MESALKGLNQLKGSLLAHLDVHGLLQHGLPQFLHVLQQDVDHVELPKLQALNVRQVLASHHCSS